MQSNRYKKQRDAKAKRVYRLRLDGVSVKQVADLVGCDRQQVRSFQLLGERLMSLEVSP